MANTEGNDPSQRQGGTPNDPSWSNLARQQPQLTDDEANVIVDNDRPEGEELTLTTQAPPSRDEIVSYLVTPVTEVSSTASEDVDQQTISQLLEARMDRIMARFDHMDAIIDDGIERINGTFDRLHAGLERIHARDRDSRKDGLLLQLEQKDERDGTNRHAKRLMKLPEENLEALKVPRGNQSSTRSDSVKGSSISLNS